MKYKDDLKNYNLLLESIDNLFSYKKIIIYNASCAICVNGTVKYFSFNKPLKLFIKWYLDRLITMLSEKYPVVHRTKISFWNHLLMIKENNKIGVYFLKINRGVINKNRIYILSLQKGGEIEC